MKTHKKYLATIITAVSIFGGVAAASEFDSQSTNNTYSFQDSGRIETQAVTGAAVASWIISSAKSAVLSQAQSWLKNQIFGSGGQPSVVNLHSDSLDQIRAIVDSSFDHHRTVEMESRFDSYVDLLNYANELGQYNDYDAGLMQTLVQDGINLVNSSAYRSNGNQLYFTLTKSRAKAYALLLSVYVEQQLNGDVSAAFVSGEASVMYSNLSSMGAAANYYVNSNIRIHYASHLCQGTIIHSLQTEQHAELETDSNKAQTGRYDCDFRVYNDFTNQQHTYRSNLLGYQGAMQAAQNKRNQLLTQYRNVFKGSDFDQVLTHLNSF